MQRRKLIHVNHYFDSDGKLRNYDDKRKNDMLACFSGKMIMINRSVTISILSTV